jgi:hypothetical protein
MLKGDLATTPLAPLLVQLAEDQATGCLHIADAGDEDALVFYKQGLVYAVSVPGHRPQLGAKLISSGALAPEALADALDAQRTELQGWRLGELLVHLGYVDQPVVEAFVKEQVHDALWDLIKWADRPWKFRKNEKTREDVAPPMPVVDLLADLRERGYEWEAISKVVNGPNAVPVLSARGGGEPETTLNPDAWSMLCKIDGGRTVAELARDCGYTMFEAGLVLVALVNAGLVDIEEALDAEPVEDERYGASTISSALAADAAEQIVGDDSFAELARLVTEVAASVRDEEPAAAPAAAALELPAPVRFNAGNDQSFAASIARVSEALSDVLGPAPAMHDPFELPSDLRIRSKKAPEKKAPITEEEARKTRARQAAAAELAAAHALAEALRVSQQEQTHSVVEAPAAVVAPVVDLAAVRREAEAARQEEERLAAEVAARAEAERLEAERLAVEEAARLAAEEAERLEAERLEAERLEAERLAAEEEAARLAAEEAARLEAARLEAERLAAEEEAARLAAEEAARLEAERLEAERLAAEEAARLEAERVEAERLAAEEAARIASEQEAARVAAEQEAARLDAERAEAEAEAWAEYWAREAQAHEAKSEHGAAASALLAELHADPVEAEAPAEDVVEEAPEEEPSPVREPATVGARASSMNEMADTAALLRELSSLGVDDEPTPPPAPRHPGPARTPARAPAAEKKKKRGLFGF